MSIITLGKAPSYAARMSDVFKLPGYMDEKELICLRNTALSMPPGALAVEVGSWKGRSTAAIAVPHVNLVCVDTFRGMPNDITAWIARREDIYSIFVSNMRRLNLHPKILVMDSIKAAGLFQNDSIDWIFLDSDHSNFRAEFYSWLPKVKPGGLVSGHDFFGWWPAIPRTLRASGYKISVMPGTKLWHFRKEKYNE